MKVIFDNNLSRYMAHALHALLSREGDYEITSIIDKFNTGSISDIEWMKALEKEGGWTVISGDIRILRSPQEREVYRKSGLIGFFMNPALMKERVTKQMQCILRVWTDIEDKSKNANSGKMFTIPIRGDIKSLKRI